jgi:hypothetical protein
MLSVDCIIASFTDRAMSVRGGVNLISILCPMHSGFGSTPEGSMMRSNQQPNRLATCQSSNHLLSFQTHSVGALA